MDVAADMKQETLSLAIGLINKMIEVTFNDIFGRIKIEIVFIYRFYDHRRFWGKRKPSWEMGVY